MKIEELYKAKCIPKLRRIVDTMVNKVEFGNTHILEVILTWKTHEYSEDDFTQISLWYFCSKLFALTIRLGNGLNQTYYLDTTFTKNYELLAEMTKTGCTVVVVDEYDFKKELQLAWQD